MSVVKIQNKNQLDQLIAKITLRLGRKPTQQEVVEHCIALGEKNFETLIHKLSPVPILDDEKYEKILQIADKFEEVEWIDVKDADFLNDADRELYSL